RPHLPSIFFFLSLLLSPPLSPLFPYTTLFRSLLRVSPHSSGAGHHGRRARHASPRGDQSRGLCGRPSPRRGRRGEGRPQRPRDRSEEHTSELQSRSDLVCRLLLEKKKKKKKK